MRWCIRCIHHCIQICLHILVVWRSHFALLGDRFDFTDRPRELGDFPFATLTDSHPSEHTPLILSGCGSNVNIVDGHRLVGYKYFTQWSNKIYWSNISSKSEHIALSNFELSGKLMRHRFVSIVCNTIFKVSSKALARCIGIIKIIILRYIL